MTRWGWALAALLVASAACTAAPVEETQPTRPQIRQPTPQPTALATPLLERRTGPMAIALHASREPLDLTRRQARKLVRGEVRDWSELVPGARGRVRMVGTLRAVVRDRNAVAVVPARTLGPQVQAARVAGIHPARRPAAYPIRRPATGPAGRGPVVTMTVTGDIMLARDVAAAARGTGDPAPALRPMSRRLRSADITVGNLESTLSRAGSPTQGGDSFGADPAVAKSLRRAGFDALSLANNHLGDFGDRALVQTVRRLHAEGLRTFGAGRDPQRANAPAVVERKGIRFGFLGFNAIGETPAVAPGQPGAVSVSMPPRTGPLDRAELRDFLGQVRRLDRQVDVVVVMPHWGTQYTNRPEPVQRQVAARLVSAGADLVVGGHPHWVQGIDVVDGTLVAHSLGNFVFDMDFMKETQEGLLLEMTYWGPELKAVELVPYRIGGDYAPRVVSRQDGRDVLQLMRATSGRAYRG